jgi:hypothetical protein
MPFFDLVPECGFTMNSTFLLEDSWRLECGTFVQIVEVNNKSRKKSIYKGLFTAAKIGVANGF